MKDLLNKKIIGISIINIVALTLAKTLYTIRGTYYPNLTFVNDPQLGIIGWVLEFIAFGVALTLIYALAWILYIVIKKVIIVFKK